MTKRYALAVHGGSFTARGDYGAQDDCIRGVLEQGRRALEGGASALDAATAAVRVEHTCRIYFWSAARNYAAKYATTKASGFETDRAVPLRTQLYCMGGL